MPHWTDPPGPVGMALSEQAAGEVGIEHAMDPPEVPAIRIGGSGGQAGWCALGDGFSPESRLRMRD